MRLQPPTAWVERDGAAGRGAGGPGGGRDMFSCVRPGRCGAGRWRGAGGRASADEAMLTGESLPVAKAPAIKVFAATVNGEGVLRCRATGVGSRHAAGRHRALVEQAQGGKPAVQRLADRIAAIFVPVVVAIALVTFRRLVVVRRRAGTGAGQCRRRAGDRLPLRAGAGDADGGDGGHRAGRRAGILVKNAEALELARRSRCWWWTRPAR
jgi:Cu+-exporting ATPase